MIRYNGYSNLVDLNQPGVFALVHVRTKRMYLSYSNNMLTAVGDHLSKAKAGTHTNNNLNKQYSNLRLYIIEVCDSNTVRSQYAYWYKKLQPGYNLVPAPQYRTRIDVDKEYRILVKLVSRSYSAIVLGVFSKMSEAIEFRKLVDSQVHIVPIYCTNELTRTYVLEHR